MTRPVDRDVLERNIERLLTRAFEPVEPRAEFRAELQRRCVARVAERWAPLPAAAPRRRWVPAALAAAAVVLVWLGLGTGLEPTDRGGRPADDLAAADPDAGAVERRSTDGLAANGGATRSAAAEEGSRDLLSRLLGAGGIDRRPIGSPGNTAGAGFSDGDGSIGSAAGDSSDADVEPAALDLALTLPEGSAAPGAVQVVLLRSALLPDVVDPVLFEAALAIEPGATRGTAGLDDLPPGRHVVHVFAAGFAPWHDEVDLPAGGRLALEVRLERGIALEGRVVDAASGAPIEGALVCSENDVPLQVLSPALDREEGVPAVTASSDVAGTFVLEPLASTRQRLRVTAPGFAPQWLEVDLSADGDWRRSAGDVRFELAPGGTILGRAADEFDRPRSGATVIVSYFESPGGARKGFYDAAVTDGDGRYRIDDLPVGMHIVLLFEGDEPDAPAAMLPVGLRAGAERRVDFVSDAGGATIDGVVVDASGRPLPFTAVTLTLQHRFRPKLYESDEIGSWTAVTADSEGRFRFEGVGAGDYALFGSAVAGSTMVLWDEVVVAPGVDRSIRLVRPDAALVGTVTAAADGAPASETIAFLLRAEPDGSTTYAGRQVADADGRFEFDGVLPGNYGLFVLPARPDLAAAHAGAVSILPGDRPEPVRIALGPGGTLELHCVDADGRPVARADIDLYDALGNELVDDGRFLTSGGGRVTIPSLAPGTWTVRAHASGFTSAESAFVAVAGEARSLTLTLTAEPTESNR